MYNIEFPDYGGTSNDTAPWQDPNMQQCPQCFQLGLPMVWFGTVPPSCQYCGYAVGRPVFPRPYPWFDRRRGCNCHCHCHCNCNCHRDWNPVQTNTSTSANADEPKKEKEEKQA